MSLEVTIPMRTPPILPLSEENTGQLISHCRYLGGGGEGGRVQGSSLVTNGPEGREGKGQLISHYGSRGEGGYRAAHD